MSERALGDVPSVQATPPPAEDDRVLENDVRFDLGMPLRRENAWTTRRIVLLVVAVLWAVAWAIGLTKVVTR